MTSLERSIGPQILYVYSFFSGETVHTLFQILRGLSLKQVLNNFFFFYVLLACLCIVLFRSQAILEVMPGMKGISHGGNKEVYILLLAVFFGIDMCFSLFFVTQSS